jgi:hypothetical protein
MSGKPLPNGTTFEPLEDVGAGGFGLTIFLPPL